MLTGTDCGTVSPGGLNLRLIDFHDAKRRKRRVN